MFTYNKWKTCGQSSYTCSVNNKLNSDYDVRACASCTRWAISKFARYMGWDVNYTPKKCTSFNGNPNY